MIASGSHTPGIDPADFRLPANAALRYEVPDDALRPYLTDYHVMDSKEPAATHSIERVLPSWAAIRIILAENPITLKAGDTLYDPLPTASLYGTITRAMEMTTRGGVTIGIGISPLGWARLFDAPASQVRDRIVPLDTMMDPALVEELVSLLRDSDRGEEVKAILDTFFLRHLKPPHPDQADVSRVMALLKDKGTTDLDLAAQRHGITPSRLRRIANRHFGYPPKKLLMRARFMRSFLPMIMGPRRSDFTLIGDEYVDISHYLRDAKRFLGTTPSRFMARPTPYLDAVLRARALVIGRRRLP